MKNKKMTKMIIDELVYELNQCELENDVGPIKDIVFGSGTILGLRNIEDNYDGSLISYDDDIMLYSTDKSLVIFSNEFVNIKHTLSREDYPFVIDSFDKYINGETR